MILVRQRFTNQPKEKKKEKEKQREISRFALTAEKKEKCQMLVFTVWRFSARALNERIIFQFQSNIFFLELTRFFLYIYIKVITSFGVSKVVE